MVPEIILVCTSTSKKGKNQKITLSLFGAGVRFRCLLTSALQLMLTLKYVFENGRWATPAQLTRFGGMPLERSEWLKSIDG